MKIEAEFPKKMLYIKECTFILPDDFNGSIEDAFDEFLKYRSDHLTKKKIVDTENLFSSLGMLLNDESDSKACGSYELYELINNNYVIIEATGIDDINTLKSEND